MKLIGILLVALTLSVMQAFAQDGTYLATEKAMNPDGFWVVADFVGGNGPAQLDPGAAFTAMPYASIPESWKSVGQHAYATSGGATGYTDMFHVDSLTINGCELHDVTVVAMGVPYVLIGAPLLKELDANLHMRDGRATFVCPSTGVTHVVGTPNNPIATSGLTQ